MLKFNFPFMNGDNVESEKNVVESKSTDNETTTSDEFLNTDSEDDKSEEESKKIETDAENNLKTKNIKKKFTPIQKKKFKTKKENKNRKLNEQTIHLINNYETNPNEPSKIKKVSDFIIKVLSSTAQYSIIVGTSSFISYSLVGNSNNFLSNVLRDAVFSSTRIISDIYINTKNNFPQLNQNNETKSINFDENNTILKPEKNIESIFTFDWFALNK